MAATKTTKHLEHFGELVARLKPLETHAHTANVARRTKIQCIIRYALFHSPAMGTQFSFFTHFQFDVHSLHSGIFFLFSSMLSVFLFPSLFLTVSDSTMIKFCLCFFLQFFFRSPILLYFNHSDANLAI